ncbi:DUF2624 family protein [Bacillus thermotolerans]|uniref:DUF2624 domain-containing protein n=1 Tax=Bacillus thermotolerans TaxID=1221996 RepID=A0A0F5IBW8_BACTR|nr:DUF2624 family protein [Bacillus thermotolerans]KKB33245.1 hypothetical protein QY97_03614 [Bacillus thermotolerans]KKB41905.1 hypothetical protein QY96_01807 [Bacillus thermotolerans]KKB43064.1 hypothetical protein QY95_02664 [Bacillus thermotolerans]
MKFLQHFINQRVQTITAEELLKYADGLDIPLRRREAEEIAFRLRRRRVDLFDEYQREELLREVADITGEQTARKLQKLLAMFE